MTNPDWAPAPEIWYTDVPSGRSFCVTDVDTSSDTIEIQHFDGDIEQIDLGEWVELDLELTQVPEDWSGLIDRVDGEDLDDSEVEARRPARRKIQHPTTEPFADARWLDNNRRWSTDGRLQHSPAIAYYLQLDEFVV